MFNSGSPHKVPLIAAALTVAFAASTIPALAQDFFHPAVPPQSVAMGIPVVAKHSGEVRRQGGFATAAAVTWTAPKDPAVFNAKTVNAMLLKTTGVATDKAGVMRQGGLAVAGAVRWVPTPDNKLSNTVLAAR